VVFGAEAAWLWNAFFVFLLLTWLWDRLNSRRCLVLDHSAGVAEQRTAFRDVVRSVPLSEVERVRVFDRGTDAKIALHLRGGEDLWLDWPFPEAEAERLASEIAAFLAVPATVDGDGRDGQLVGTASPHGKDAFSNRVPAAVRARADAAARGAGDAELAPLWEQVEETGWYRPTSPPITRTFPRPGRDAISLASRTATKSAVLGACLAGMGGLLSWSAVPGLPRFVPLAAGIALGLEAFILGRRAAALLRRSGSTSEGAEVLWTFRYRPAEWAAMVDEEVARHDVSPPAFVFLGATFGLFFGAVLAWDGLGLAGALAVGGLMFAVFFLIAMGAAGTRAVRREILLDDAPRAVTIERSSTGDFEFAIAGERGFLGRATEASVTFDERDGLHSMRVESRAGQKARGACLVVPAAQLDEAKAFAKRLVDGVGE